MTALFLSTGRCGTQWLARHLGEVCGGGATVTHEPLGASYRPRYFFRGYSVLNEQLRVKEIAEHVDWIQRRSRTTTYVETGWPCFAAIPLLIEHLDDVKIVHLTRHPIPSALSHMVHQTYGGSPRVDPYTQLAALDPSCPRVFQDDYQQRWPSLTPYEKTLFWWTEVHRYAGELHQRYPDVPFLRIKSEDLLSGDPAHLARLMDFLELEGADEMSRRRRQREDRWHHRTHLDFDPGLIREHPLALGVSAQLDYDVDDVDPGHLEQRYKREGWDPAAEPG